VPSPLNCLQLDPAFAGNQENLAKVVREMEALDPEAAAAGVAQGKLHLKINGFDINKAMTLKDIKVIVHANYKLPSKKNDPCKPDGK